MRQDDPLVRIILSTVNVKSGVNKPTVTPLVDALGEVNPIDRSSINAWEDVEFRRAVEATGRRKLVMTALWTEACLLFPSSDLMRLGYEVFVPVDAVGGHRCSHTRSTSPIKLDRVVRVVDPEHHEPCADLEHPTNLAPT